VLTVFGDESHDQTKQRVFAVGAVIGDTSQWEAFSARWKERMGEMVFHAADCESRRGQFRHLSEQECHRLHRDLTRILAESALVGWGAAVDIAGVRAAFPDVLKDQIYLSCFLRSIKYMADKALLRIPRSAIHFTFDQHDETEYNSGLLYEYLKADTQGDGEALLSEEISFGSRKSVGIQAADLWARELMKRFDSCLFDERSTERPQWNMLMRTKRFGADFVYGGYFADLRARYESISTELGMNPSEYRAWLVKKRRQDNQSNRILYMMDMDAKERKRKNNDLIRSPDRDARSSANR
jgi:hypothetical protein